MPAKNSWKITDEDRKAKLEEMEKVWDDPNKGLNQRGQKTISMCCREIDLSEQAYYNYCKKFNIIPCNKR